MTDRRDSASDATRTAVSGGPLHAALVVVVLGAIAGLGAGLLTLLLYGVERLALGFVETSSQPGPFLVEPWRRIVSVVAGACLAAVAWWLLRSRAKKVPSVAGAVSGERMPIWQTVTHVCLQILIVGCGSSIGREVAPRELGAMLGQRFGDLLHVDDPGRRRTIVAIAAAAGLAGVYDAPFAGLFFATEILLTDASAVTAAMALGASSVAAFVAALIKGHRVFYDISGLSPTFTPTLMLFALLAGAVFGMAGAAFRIASRRATSRRPRGAGILWMMPAAALVTGLVAIKVPQVMGNGRASAQLAMSMLSSSQSVRTVAAVAAVTFLAKALVTLMTLRSGASGGVLQPGIALGVSLGTLLGCGWTLLVPGDSMAACAVMGGAALLAASQQAPLMAMCLVLELVDAPMSLVVPVGLAVAVSFLVSKRIESGWLRRERKAAPPVPSER